MRSESHINRVSLKSQCMTKKQGGDVKLVPYDINCKSTGEKFSFLDDIANEENTVGSSHLMTLSGEMSVVDLPNNKTTSLSKNGQTTPNQPAANLLRI